MFVPTGRKEESPVSFEIPASALRRTVLGPFLVLALALAFLASTPRPAYAIAGYICDDYSDATYTSTVGRRGADCCGRTVSWGTTSSFSRCVRQDCIWCPPQQ